MKKLVSMDWLAMAIVAIAGINYLVVGLFGFSFMEASSVAGRFVYAIFGACSIYLVVLSKPAKK